MSSRPNIVIIIADDLRADALADPLVQTPNLDALAADGVTFKQNYAANPVCAPSRMANFTGLYPSVTGHRSLYNMLRPHEENLFRFLREDGYETVFVGKNDMMTEETLKISFDKRLGGMKQLMLERVKALPPEQQQRIGKLLAKGASFSALTRDPAVMKELAAVMPMARNPYPPDHRLYNAHYFGKAEKDPHMDAFIFDEAVRYLQSPPQHPFCLYVASFLPHTPYHVEEPYFSMYDRDAVPQPIPPELDDKPHFMRELYRRMGMERLTPEDYREIRAVYYGMVTKLDVQIGKIIDELKAQGLYDDSLIIFLSDHGDYAGDYGLPEKWPSDLKDVLVHVPLIIKYPASRAPAAGVQVNELTQSLDLFPTVMEQAGIETAYTHFGQSLTPVAQGQHGREAVYAVAGYDLREPQAFEKPMKSQHAFMGQYYHKVNLQNDDPTTVARSTMLRTKDWKLIIRSSGKEELYNLKEDPYELTNLIDDPTLEDLRCELRNQLLYWYLRTSDNPHWKRERGL
jgi:choline-sulfatase